MPTAQDFNEFELTMSYNLILLKAQIDSIKKTLSEEQKVVYNSSMNEYLEKFLISTQGSTGSKYQEIADLFRQALV